MTDFRALCAELVQLNEVEVDDWTRKWADAVKRTKAALAEGDGVGVTDEEAIARIVYERALRASAFEEVQRFWPRWEDLPDSQARDCAFNAARAVLARYGTTHPRPIPVVKGDILLQAVKSYIEETEVRSDGEWGSCRTLRELLDARLMPDVYWQVLNRLAEQVGSEPTGAHPRPIPPLDATRQLILKLTAELARLHDSETQTLDLIAEARAFIDADHPRPIPVAERLPTAADCDAEGRCWWWYPATDMTYGYWAYEDEAMERAFSECPVAWLPHSALPLPTQTDGEAGA